MEKTRKKTELKDTLKKAKKPQASQSKSLQKLTDFESKVDTILKQEKITKEDACAVFEEDEIFKFYGVINDKINSFQGIDRDRFLEKIEPMLFNSQKNQLWEHNHIEIMRVISNLMQEKNRMPSKNEIAAETGLSRQTIHKHVKEYASHPQYMDQIQQFRFMSSKLLAKVFKFAVNGDVRAAKLYFDIVGGINAGGPNNTFIQQQNNFIQINGTVLSQEAVKHLSPEQLTQIENIIKSIL